MLFCRSDVSRSGPGGRVEGTSSAKVSKNHFRIFFVVSVSRMLGRVMPASQSDVLLFVCFRMSVCLSVCVWLTRRRSLFLARIAQLLLPGVDVSTKLLNTFKRTLMVLLTNPSYAGVALYLAMNTVYKLPRLD